MNTTKSLTSLLLTLLLLAGLTVPAMAQDEAQLHIVTTTTQATDLVNILGGEHIRVTGLMGPGVDPHLYQPTESDIAAMNEADAVFYSGLHLEGQFDTVFEGLGERDILTYAIARPVDQAGFVFNNFNPDASGQGTADPHFWFDPRNWQLTVTATAEVLGELDPAHADEYLANAEAYNAQLDLLFAWASDAMLQIPERQRVLVTSHDAFQYFGSAFGWTVRGLQGISTEDEAGVADVQEVAGFVVENEIPVMFVESSVPPDAIEAVQEAVQSQGFEVGIGVRELYSDAMGAPDEFGGTYIGMIAQNVITVLQSYGYEVPAWPDGLEPAPPAELIELAAVGD